METAGGGGSGITGAVLEPEDESSVEQPARSKVSSIESIKSLCFILLLVWDAYYNLHS